MKNSRYTPDELYAKFRDSHDAVTAREFFNSPVHKKTQELYCAARFAQALSGVCDCWVLVSDVDEQTDADFHLEVVRKYAKIWDRPRFSLTNRGNVFPDYP